MWVLKLKKSSEGTLIGALAQKHKVSFSGYPISHQLVGERLHVRVAGFIEGEQRDIDRFVRAARREPFIAHITHNKNFAIALLKLHPALELLYTPEIVFVQPARYGKDGTELLEVACASKEPLMRVLALYRQKFKCDIISFSQRKLDSIGLISIHPDLTERQRSALQLAVAHGYYSCPRRITLEKLAQIMGVSFSTYQAHLAKAEAKFMTEMAGKFL